MNHDELLRVWILIVGVLSIVYVVSLMASTFTAKDASERIMRMLDKHRENMCSDGQSVRDDSRQRWRECCRMLERDYRNVPVAALLRDEGARIERQADRERSARVAVEQK